MSTKTIKSKKTTKTGNQQDQSATIAGNNNSGEYKELNIEQIDYSPFNYRKIFSLKDLQAFAVEIAQHGIISSLTVRPMSTGRYELVAGERRLRAATIAKLTTVPVVVKNYTDEEVIEIQLAENLQRENPHPMHEAQGIGQMQKTGKTIEEIAARLGKSKAFVYSRIKLLALIEPFQEMFLAEVINIQQAFEIGSLSSSSQQEFFDEYCEDWKTQKGFDLDDLEYALSRFKYDLKEAPFNTKDKKLIPEMGACTACSFNTATLKTLFPEYAKEAICTNKECYHKKCSAYFSLLLASALLEHKPAALIFSHQPSKIIKDSVESVAGATELPAYNSNDISIIQAPEMPVPEDYTNEDETEKESQFDEAEFKNAMEEYEEDMGQYKNLLENSKVLKGLFVTEHHLNAVLFSLEKRSNNNRTQTVTAKDVQAAIKTGAATPELLQAEIERLNTKEERAKELDREKIQLAVHEQFSSEIESVSNITSLTTADEVAARLLIYQSLNYYTRSKVGTQLFSSTEEDNGKNENQLLYEKLATLTDIQYSYLIRNAITCQADSKFLLNVTGYSLYKQAEGAGLNVEAIEHAQEQKAITREAKQLERIKELETKISKLKNQ